MTIPALGRQEDCAFEACLGCTVRRSKYKPKPKHSSPGKVIPATLSLQEMAMPRQGHGSREASPASLRAETISPIQSCLERMELEQAMSGRCAESSKLSGPGRTGAGYGVVPGMARKRATSCPAGLWYLLGCRMLAAGESL